MAYTTNMSLFVQSTPAPRARAQNILSVRLLLAGSLAAIALLQLFTFEEFPARLADVGIAMEIAPLLATLLVVIEVLALPFVLRMQLSPAFRVLSMGLGWLASLMLVWVAVLENITSPNGLDAVFGATLSLPVGGWTICAALALCVLSAWTSWAMWPLQSKK